MEMSLGYRRGGHWPPARFVKQIGIAKGNYPDISCGNQIICEQIIWRAANGRPYGLYRRIAR